MSRSAKHLQNSDPTAQLGIGILLIIVSFFLSNDRYKAYTLFGGIILVIGALAMAKNSEMSFAPPGHGEMPFADKYVKRLFMSKNISSVRVRYGNIKYDNPHIEDIDHDEISIMTFNNNSKIPFGYIAKRYPEDAKDDILVILKEDLGYETFFDVELHKYHSDETYKHRTEWVGYKLKFHNEELGLNDEILFKIVNEVCILHSEVLDEIIN